GVTQVVHQAGRNVGRDRDIAVPAQQHKGGGGGVIATDDHEIFGCVAQQQAAAAQVAGGVFDTDDVRNLRQAQGGFVREVSHAAARHVVQNHRKIDGFGDLPKVLVHAFLGGAVVIRHDRETRLCAHRFGVLCELYGFAGGVAPYPCDNGNAPRRVLDSDSNDLSVFVEINRG